MKELYYTDERNVQILISALKSYNIKKIIASPGTTNMTFIASIQQDEWFEIYSSVDERSAAYIACGMSAESKEPVVLTCTGATASRNYMPGLTEAYYRKLPILAVTSTQSLMKVGNYCEQVIDRSVLPNDIANLSVTLSHVRDKSEEKNCELQVSRAVSALFQRGGGPVHINIETTYSRNFSVRTLPETRIIKRVTLEKDFPQLPKGRIAIFVGSHVEWSQEQTNLLDRFCELHNAVVFCNQTSNYKGKYRILYSLVRQQEGYVGAIIAELMIHIGMVAGYNGYPEAKQIWRVNEDGEMRDTFNKLTYVFEMSEKQFFEYYNKEGDRNKNVEYYQECRKNYQDVYNAIDAEKLPFSNMWMAYKTAPLLPANSALHLGILYSLRCWSLFEIPQSVLSYCNVGGFGIDGNISSLIGASLVHKHRLYFGVVGDLAFFYDLNSLGNRHIGNNLRILLINNGKGAEFRRYSHPAYVFGDEADKYIAAGGHYGNQSHQLIKHYASDLGFEYLCASNKEEYEQYLQYFISPETKKRSIIFETFTNSEDESNALKAVLNVKANVKGSVKKAIRSLCGDKGIDVVRKIIGK